MSNKSRNFDIMICLFTGIISMLVFCGVFHIWNFELKVPLQYGSGDAVGVLQRVNEFVRGERLSNVQGLGAPYGSNQCHQLFDGYLPQLCLFILAKITRNVGYTINFYYILTYVFSSMCTYYVLRKLQISQITAMACGIIYAFIPGHMLRSIAHIFIGSSFVLPLMILAVIYLSRGDLCKFKYQNIKKITVKEAFYSIDKKMLFCVISLAFITFSSLYYGIFSLFLITFAAVYAMIDKKQWRHFLYYLLLCLTELVSIVMIYLPEIISRKLDENFESLTVVTRVMGEVEFYGLKLIQMVLPIKNHRLPALAKITEIYNTNFSVNENSLSTLGLVMSVGFLASFFIVFFKITLCDEELRMYSKMNLFMLCLATIGGGASIIAYINCDIRCYNRFSFFIGFVSIIIFGKLFDNIWENLKERYKSVFLQSGKIIVTLLLICTAVLDQTTSEMAYSKDSGAAAADKYFNDKEFVKDIENYEDGNAVILMLPIMCGKDGGFGLSVEGVNNWYAPKFLYVHSETSNWSDGALLGEQADYFLSNLSSQSSENILKIASVMGFSGIAIYYPGYEEDRLQEWREVLETNLGVRKIENENGTWAYYSLSDYTAKLKNQFSNDEWDKLHAICYENSFVLKTVLGKNLCNSNEEAKFDGDAMLVYPGDRQYGPYERLQAGTYQVTIQGKNLENAVYRCTSEFDLEKINAANMKISDTLITYEIVLQKDSDTVEFLCENTTDKNIKIDQIQYIKIIDSDNDLIYRKLLGFDHLY